MKINEYAKLAKRTAKDMGTEQLNLFHGALGIAGEAGELCDAIQKSEIYNKPRDVDNIVEELGDLLWYIILVADTIKIDLDDIMAANIAKLAVRYPDKYSDQLAALRLDKSE